MKLRRLPIFSLALLIGCSGSSTTPTTKTPETKPAPSAEKPKPAGVPDAFKHDGYEYYGFGNTKPLTMTLIQGAQKVTGAQENKLLEIKPDYVVYQQSWTGGLAANGVSKLRVTADGVYEIESQGKELKPAQLDIPAKLTPGFVWKSTTKITVNGATVESTMSKVVGLKSITVGKAAHSVMVISRTSQVDINGKKKTLESTEYYEKGVGPIKVDVKVTGGGEPNQAFSMEHTE